MRDKLRYIIKVDDQVTTVLPVNIGWLTLYDMIMCRRYNGLNASAYIIYPNGEKERMDI